MKIFLNKGLLVIKRFNNISNLSLSLQDAQEFFLYLLSVIEKNQRTASSRSISVVDLFKFQVIIRTVCKPSDV